MGKSCQKENMAKEAIKCYKVNEIRVGQVTGTTDIILFGLRCTDLKLDYN